MEAGENKRCLRHSLSTVPGWVKMSERLWCLLKGRSRECRFAQALTSSSRACPSGPPKSLPLLHPSYLSPAPRVATNHPPAHCTPQALAANTVSETPRSGSCPSQDP